MKRLQDLQVIYKAILIVIALVGGLYFLDLGVLSVGYVLLFGGLFVIFEGFGLSLFWKILIGLVLGAVIPLLKVVDPALLVAVKPVGSHIFMNLLTMALVPLVFSSIFTGVTKLGDIHRLNRIGLRTICYYIVTTMVAITIGLVFANIIQPGKGLSPEIRQQFSNSYKEVAEGKVAKAEASKKTLFETVQGIVPKNILHSSSTPKPNMLALIFFAVLCGVAVLHMKSDAREPLVSFFTSLTDMTIHLIMMAMRVAPYGVFSIIVANIAQTQSLELMVSLVPFSLCVLLGLFVHAVGTNSFSLRYLSKRPILTTMAKMRSVLLTAFSTASSGATMPMTLEVTEEDLKVKNEVAGFVIPLGATINMDGTALFQGVSAIFLANIYGINLELMDQITIIGMAVMASVGTAAVPGVGIVILTMILTSVGIPPEGILFILPVNNVLDMCRTSVNVMGDMTCAIYVDSCDISDTSEVST